MYNSEDQTPSIIDTIFVPESEPKHITENALNLHAKKEWVEDDTISIRDVAISHCCWGDCSGVIFAIWDSFSVFPYN